MIKISEITGCLMVQIFGISKKVINCRKISGKDDILTVEYKLIFLIGIIQKKPWNYSMTKGVRGNTVEGGQDADKNELKKGNIYCQILVGKYVEGSYMCSIKRL